uniref:(northern house mosquito) hypothetical protein n=3 Tax=Culex pipiens TaxID=7175 RepID=A0A8D8GCV1_CULPI
MKHIVVKFGFFFVISIVTSSTTFLNNINYLRDNKLENLLMILKTTSEVFKSHNREQNAHGYDAKSEQLLESSHVAALPLIEGPDRKSSFEAMATNPSKIQSILQLSVAALAFLAFAGYLLCMIVQAIKSKGITYFHQAVSPVAISAASKKKRPIRNKRHLGLDNEEKHGNNCFRIVYFPIIRASEYIVQKFLLADNLTH